MGTSYEVGQRTDDGLVRLPGVDSVDVSSGNALIYSRAIGYGARIEDGGAYKDWDAELELYIYDAQAVALLCDAYLKGARPDNFEAMLERELEERRASSHGAHSWTREELLEHIHSAAERLRDLATSAPDGHIYQGQ